MFIMFKRFMNVKDIDPHAALSHIERANEFIERAKYSSDYHNDLILDHLIKAGEALDEALDVLRYGNITQPDN